MAMNREKVKLDTTNSVVVRFKKGGTRFEALANRQTYLVALEEARKDIKKFRKEGVPVKEADLETLLVDEQLYLNAAKGQAAKKEDIEKAFYDKEHCPKPTLQIALVQLLSKGESQLSEQDRQKSSKGEGDKMREIATVIASKIINPLADPKAGRNAKYYTVEEVEREIKNIKYTLKNGMGTLDQASFMITALKKGENIAVERTQTKVTLSGDDNDQIFKYCEEHPAFVRVIKQDTTQLVVSIDPECCDELKKMCDKWSESQVKRTKEGLVEEEEDLTLHCASPPEEKKKKLTKKEKQKQRAEDDDGEDDEPVQKQKKGKRKGKKNKGGDDDDDDEKEEPQEQEKEKEKPKPKPKGKKGKKGKGGDDSDDEPRGRRGKGNLLDDLAALGGGGSDDDDAGPSGGAFDALAGGKKKGKKKK